MCLHDRIGPMAVGLINAADSALEGSSKQMVLRKGQTVKYWSTSRSKWVGAVVNAVDEQGAVRLSVKPHVWVGRLEQAAKVRQEPSPGQAAELPNARADKGYPRQPAAAAADPRRQPDKSRQLFSLFAEWDAKRPRDAPLGDSDAAEVGLAASKAPEASPSAATVSARAVARLASEDLGAPTSSAAPARPLELRVFASSMKELRQFEMAVLDQPQRSMRKRVTSLIWRIFYREIRSKAAELKKLQEHSREKQPANGSGTPRVVAAKRAGAELEAALSEAEAYLQRLCSAVQRRVDTAQASSGSEAQTSPKVDALKPDARHQARLHCVGQLHTMLADIERYRAMHGVGDAPRALQRAEQLYCSALEAFPQIGQAFNQRGLLAAFRGDHLGAVLCGFRILRTT